MSIQHFDVIIIGAGLSGICMAHYLKNDCPNKSFAILEARERIGGTWDLFQYPGVRSDSDMSTLGYRFRPWKEEQQIADGPSILKYIKETAKEENTYEHILFDHKLAKADWSSKDNKWSLKVNHSAEEATQLTCSFLVSCTGYYDYDKGHTPKFKGLDKYKGQFIHPQFWPKDLDFQGKKVTVIGSGATAVTLVPAMAKQGAGHVTMLQRSPTYFIAMPMKDLLAKRLEKIMPQSWAYKLVRWKNIGISLFSYGYSKAKPKKMKEFFIGNVKKMLPKGYDVEKHFTPSYNPWDQRLCLVPDGDFFKEIRNGRTSVVTEHIDQFTEKGILLKSGEELEADIVISATGLVILPVGGIEATIDGKPFELQKSFSYKGTMVSDVPNFGLILGYTNASWTLKADLSSEYLCKLINLMDKKNCKAVIPRYKGKGKGKQVMTELESGYIDRAKDLLPYNGDKKPWKIDQHYIKDVISFRYSKIQDGHLEFKE
ncbi:MAG: monooxygenase [Maribacter sp.]|jgi:monooxygenase